LNDLEYLGKKLTWSPTRLHCIHVSGPLLNSEFIPGSEEYTAGLIRRLLFENYAIYVELQPGDATRYGLILHPMQEGFIVTRLGGKIDWPLLVNWHEELSDPITSTEALSLGNPWTAKVLYWWLDNLLRAFD
jgi:hypothetical protein